MRLFPATFLFVFLFAADARAQDPLGWNSQRALDLVARARVRRELPRGDSTLQNYTSKANGYVYFYLDRPGSEERTLVRVDQIAIDLFFKRPNLTKQQIVGMRDVNRLPNRMYYHLDHLTVVQNGLGDVIRIGDGDEVRDVPHPAAPGADTVYDYRLADSVTLQMGGDQPVVRVYEIQVRPKRLDRPALIGSIYVDRASADIVRMTFTFTPASYVDKRLDYINISLDNGLFGGRYWLPNEQSVEIRRQIPELDFAAGSVIKGRIHISKYEFNANIPDSIFFGRPVSAASEQERKNYPFPQDIYADLNTEGLAPPPQMEDLRARAAELVKSKRLSGLPPFRLYVPNSSSVLRHNDAEGWYAGAGVAYVRSPSFRINALGGYAFGAERPELSLGVHQYSNDVHFALTGYLDRPRDVGPVPGMPGVLNTFTSGFGDRDYTDTYLTRGLRLDVEESKGNWRMGVFGLDEWHIDPIPCSPSEPCYRRPVNGHAIQAGYTFTRETAERGTFNWGLNGELGFVHFESTRLGSYNFVRGLFNASLQAVSENTRTSLTGTVHAGINSTDTPPQYALLVGGRETLPGYDYRSFSGKHFASMQVELARTIAYPWIRARAIGAAALTPPSRLRGPDIIMPDVLRSNSYTLAAASSNESRLRASAGAGVGLLWDVIRVDVVKGAHWQTLFSVRHDFWDLL